MCACESKSRGPCSGGLLGAGSLRTSPLGEVLPGQCVGGGQPVNIEASTFDIITRL